MPDNETHVVVESSKPSKLDKIKSAAITTAWVAIPVGVLGGLTFVSYKTFQMQLETARLNLETAKLKQS